VPPCLSLHQPLHALARPLFTLQLEVLERLANVLVGHQMLPAKLGDAIAQHAQRAVGG